MHVEWAWESSIKQLLHLSTSVSGFITDLDMGCVAGWGFGGQFYFDLLLPYGLASVITLGCGLACCCGYSPFGA